jgi:hypothetical protein
MAVERAELMRKFRKGAAFIINRELSRSWLTWYLTSVELAPGCDPAYSLTYSFTAGTVLEGGESTLVEVTYTPTDADRAGNGNRTAEHVQTSPVHPAAVGASVVSGACRRWLPCPVRVGHRLGGPGCRGHIEWAASPAVG